jgi:SAM-dependent methyltransferase
MTETTAPSPLSSDDEEVREYYRGKALAAAGSGSCCDPSAEPVFGPIAYAGIGPNDAPDAALLASLGCGNPIAVAELREGETVLDLGCGGGLDLILSANRVGPSGLVYGLDFLEEMLALARRNIVDSGHDNIVLLKGTIESIPLPGDTVDVVISNCVINLSADKEAVFAEMFRILAPGGRIGISDVVAEDHLTPADRAERGSRAQCVAGALSVSEYTTMLRAAGLEEVEVALTDIAAAAMHTAIVRAAKPADATSAYALVG